MSAANENTTPDSSVVEIELKNPTKAALLAWLVPGAGHLYQGRTGKGVLFAVCILGTFFYGMYLGGGRVVYASTTNPIASPGKFLQRWQYACQLPVGIVAVPAYMQAWRVEMGDQPLLGDNFERPPYDRESFERVFRKTNESWEADGGKYNRSTVSDSIRGEGSVRHANEAAKWNYDLGFAFELGTIYTVIAGLMNVLAIYDAHSGPVMPKADDDEENKNKSDDKTET